MLTSALGAISLLTYVFVYTPLKRVTWLNTVVGAVPGGLPPLMGWTAARGHLSADGWALFGILALWQLPHFMAIAWMYRDEYARAGFKMLPVIDPDGQRTGSQAVTHSLALVPVSLCPSMMNLTGQWYFFGALILGLIFIGSAVQFSRQLTLSKARQLFYVSILYLPLLLGLMVLDKAR
jgi:heme o synthase